MKDWTHLTHVVVTGHWSLVGFLGLSPIAVTALPQLQLQQHRFPNRSTVACWPELGGLTWVWLEHMAQPSLSTQMSQFLQVSKQFWQHTCQPKLVKEAKVNGRLLKRSFLAVAEHRLDSFFLKRVLREVQFAESHCECRRPIGQVSSSSSALLQLTVDTAEMLWLGLSPESIQPWCFTSKTCHIIIKSCHGGAVEVDMSPRCGYAITR